MADFNELRSSGAVESWNPPETLPGSGGPILVIARNWLSGRLAPICVIPLGGWFEATTADAQTFEPSDIAAWQPIDLPAWVNVGQS